MAVKGLICRCKGKVTRRKGRGPPTEINLLESDMTKAGRRKIKEKFMPFGVGEGLT